MLLIAGFPYNIDRRRADEEVRASENFSGYNEPSASKDPSRRNKHAPLNCKDFLPLQVMIKTCLRRTDFLLHAKDGAVLPSL